MAAGISLVATTALVTWLHGHKVSNLEGQVEKVSTCLDTPYIKYTSLQNAAGMSPKT